MKVTNTNGLIKAFQLKDKIKNIFNVDLSINYVSYLRNRYGFNKRRSNSRPELTELQKQERLAFALRYEHSTYKNWLFVDETTVYTVFGIWQRSNKKLNIWGGIGWNGAIKFVLFKNNLTAPGYEDIVENYLELVEDIVEN